MDPRVLQVKSITHSHVFNKIDFLFFTLARKISPKVHTNNYILWNSKLQQMP